MPSRKIKSVEVIVRQILRDDVAARDSDKYLTFKVMQKYLSMSGDTLTITVDDFNRIPAFATIKRIRAHVQNVEHLYLPTDEDVRKARKIQEQDWLDWVRKNTNPKPPSKTFFEE